MEFSAAAEQGLTHHLWRRRQISLHSWACDTGCTNFDTYCIACTISHIERPRIMRITGKYNGVFAELRE